jgi:hypothetical protein
VFYDYYLHVMTPNAIQGQLIAAGLAHMEDGVFVLEEGVFLDEYREVEPDGVDVEDNPKWRHKPGYCANLRTTFPVTSPIPSITPPVEPQRIWAGGINYIAP